MTGKIEEKLFENRYNVDAGRPHVRIRQHDTPSKALLALITVCPAGFYRLDDGGRIEVVPDGCMECGSCRILTAGSGDLEWDYPRGGYGVLFKFG